MRLKPWEQIGGLWFFREISIVWVIMVQAKYDVINDNCMVVGGWPGIIHLGQSWLSQNVWPEFSSGLLIQEGGMYAVMARLVTLLL